MLNDPDTLICGIDLGTTNSCIAVIQPRGEPQVIHVDGRATMPSVVACRDGEWLVGEAARNHLWVAPHEAVASIKRKMDDPQYRVTLGGESLSPMDVSAKILAALAQAAQASLQSPVRKVVITVPAWFKESQRQATLAAGQRAGLEVIQIINEPTAAAIAHQNIPIAEGDEEKWLVYDLGGGTFDVSVLSVTSAAYEVLASQGNTFLGGDDFDRRLQDKFVAHLRDCHNIDPTTDATAQARLALLAEKTKIQLSGDVSVDIKEPVVVAGKTYLLDLMITREAFESLIDDLLESTIEKAKQTLADAGIHASSIKRLLLVGGSTRIPVIAERLAQQFGLEPESWVDPDLSVAIGACVRGAISEGAVFERSVVDICPHSLGIAVLGEEDIDADMAPIEGENAHPLTFASLVRRNSRLPAQFVRTFYKTHDHQERVVVAVYQGESSNTRHNTFIGEFEVDLHNHHDATLDVRFAYDVNGTIKITVKEGGDQKAVVYTMDLSRSADENSDLNTFSEHEVLDGEVSAVDDSPEVTNYLIEKVSQRLKSEGDAAPDTMHELLTQYKTMLEQDSDEGLDDVEDRLYEWIEGQP